MHHLSSWINGAILSKGEKQAGQKNLNGQNQSVNGN